ncbi:UDP-3-O-(3-hydroxymyristoyl)glucosamine N-acyltransferase [Brevundimonas sp.]|uniref:UDP-3-O-(3-hydroxymyristoyl)glucosamine N-acyltransferase n=1 Tax=Brevundimonas sp. TaxID=1871086 RepID=UPI002630A182|nr:UDP-3-O-(3-hydroxymyristoyl)glucosamine N-acyltransferase [Brevundimonas sp.]
MVTCGDIAGSDATIERVVGDAARTCHSVAPLNHAGPGTLTFANSRTPASALNTAELAGATIVCAEATLSSTQPRADITFLISSNPRLSLMRAAAAYFSPPPLPPGVHPTAVVAADAVIDPTAHIGPGVVIGSGARIGARCSIHANVVVYERVRIGEGVIINAGTVVGADGFGYERNERGELEKFPHLGGVVIEDEVEIGSNTSIDRGTLGDTVLKRRCRIDNQVHIAHNVVVGEDAAVIAQSMVGGSVRIGDRAWLAPAAVIMNKADVGTDAVVGLGAVVVKSVADGQTVMGSPAVPDDEFRALRRALKGLIGG